MPAAFVVFQDPEEVTRSDVGLSKLNMAPNVLQAKTTTVSPVDDFNPEKENFDPLTGQRITGVSANAKKRKSPALTPKAVPVFAVRTNSTPSLALAPKQPTTKKPRAASVSGARPAPKRKSSDRKPARRPSPKRVFTMPDIHEVPESSPEKRLAQRLIDERCYDFTVSPLADVTSMFDTVVSLNDVHEEPGMPIALERSQLLLEDYPLGRPTRNACLPKMMTVGLSTPERQKLTAQFTFNSPSRSAERAKLVRSTSSPAVFDGGMPFRPTGDISLL